MIHRKPIKTWLLLVLAGIVLGSWILTARVEGAGLPDGVTLTVDTGPGPDDVTLDWTGGQPMFGIYRSTAADDVDELINQIAQTTGSSWIDAAFSSDLYFYYIKSPCVVNPPEVCDGVDNDCDGDIDEDYVPTPTTCGQGQCAGNTGEIICQGGVEVDTCDPFDGASPDWCDGLDNDCWPGTDDGSDDPDLGLPCDGDDGDLCQEGGLECVYGNLECSDFSFDDLDVCNGQDDDCDPSSADGSEEGIYGEPCDGPDSDSCLEGVWDCVGGTMICNDTSGNTLDVCDGMDNDCDPSTPDGAHHPGAGNPCDGPDSDLCNEGEMECINGNFYCNESSMDDLDVCNGFDDDCDPASADGSEDPQVGIACDGPDWDLCIEGTIACVGGGLWCSDQTGTTAELCNGIDDDCDGDVDEDYPGDQPAVCTDGQFYLGAVDGDQGGGLLTDSLWTETWDRFTLTEASGSTVYISATISLWSPPETDYDLFVYCGSCGGTLAGSSTLGGYDGHWDTVTVRAEDEGAIDDTIDLIVEVRYYDSNICAFWDLEIRGNTAVETTTCD